MNGMAAWRRAIELSLGDADVRKLRSIAQSRTEPASRVERARILLGYRDDPSFFAVGQALGLHHQTVQRCVERAVVEGPMAALDDRPRPGREPTITIEAKAWLTSLACRKAKELGYPHELWTTRLLARHAREHGPAEGHACLSNLAQGTVCKILDQEEVSNVSKLEFHSVEIIKRCLMSGIGISVLPEIAVKDELAQKKLVILPWSEGRIEVALLMIWYRERWLSPNLKAFMEMAQKFLRSPRRSN